MTGAMVVLIFLGGIACGVIGTVSVLIVARPVDEAPLPAATARALKRARRHARLQLARPRWVAPASDDFEGRS